MVSYKEKLVGFYSSADLANDTNKDLQGKGTLQRMNELAGSYLDDETLPFIRNLIANTRVPSTLAAKLLPNAEQVFGLDVYTGYDTDSRRRMLQLIFNLRKIKGTKKAFDVLFSMLKIKAQLQIIEGVYGLDSPITLDDPNRRFDQKCKACVGYGLTLTASQPYVRADLTVAISSIVNYNTPVDATLEYINLNGISLVIESPNRFNDNKYVVR